MSLHLQDLDALNNGSAGVVDAIKHRLGSELAYEREQHGVKVFCMPLVESLWYRDNS